MKKITINLFAFVIALFTSQGINAQEVLFEESFNNGLGEFVIEGGNENNSSIWVYSAEDLGIKVDPYDFMGLSEEYEAYLVSPEITLGTGNTASYDSKNRYFVDASKDAGLCIRLAGTTEWTSLEIPTYSDDISYFESTGNIVIPASFEGKNVQFGFKYYAAGKKSAGVMYLKNFVVNGTPGGGDTPAPVEKTVIFEETFATSQTYGGDLCGFRQESPTNVYSWDNYGNGVFGTYMGGAEGGNLAISYLVSPEISLLASNVVTFDYEALNFAEANMTRDMAFAVREVGGTWEELQIPNLNNTDYGLFVSSGEIVIPEKYNYKKVEIAFKYSSDGDWSAAGSWTIKNLVVKGVDDGSAPVEKVDPAIAFDAAEVAYTMGDVFTAPVLANPNNVAVTYSSSDEAVATVDAEGIVTVLGEGVTTIKAMSAETEQYLAGEASYVLTVTKAAGGVAEVLFEETFADGLGQFTEDNGDGTHGFWQHFSYYSSFLAAGSGVKTDSRLVSPEIQLGKDNTIAFTCFHYDFTNFASQITISIKEVGGEWQEVSLGNVVDYSWEDVLVNVPAEFNDKNVQIAFRFNAVNGTFCGRNFVVKGVKGAAPVEKVDPAIAFDVTEVAYTMGEEFTAPVLANPNNVAVTYSSSDEAVATVDAEGIVTVLGEGVTTIKAMSAETEQYLAGEASYVLTVTKAAGGEGTEEVIFEETFAGGLGQFTEENANGLNSFWQEFSYYSAAMAVSQGASVDSRLVSPEMTLANDNTIAFECYFYDFTDLASQFTMSIREVNGEWQELSVGNLADFNWVNALINVPAEFNGKKVQIAFRYLSSQGTLCVRNLVVKGVKGAAPVEKADPEIAFDVTEISYTASDEVAFVAPELINPNNVEVAYSSSDESVATVDALTGEVTFVAEGVVIITATSVETEEFKSATASYTITYTIPTGIEGITADDLKNGKVYNLQGVRVDKLGKGIYIVNGKKVVIK